MNPQPPCITNPLFAWALPPTPSGGFSNFNFMRVTGAATRQLNRMSDWLLGPSLPRKRPESRFLFRGLNRVKAMSRPAMISMTPEPTLLRGLSALRLVARCGERPLFNSLFI